MKIRPTNPIAIPMSNKINKSLRKQVQVPVKAQIPGREEKKRKKRKKKGE